jgi:hypothetical protein
MDIKKFDEAANRAMQSHADIIARIQFLPIMKAVVVRSGEEASKQDHLSEGERVEFAKSELLKNLKKAKDGNPWAEHIIAEIEQSYT